MTEQRKPGRPKTTGSTPARTIRVPDEEWRLWQDKAFQAHKSLTQWLRDLANESK